MPPYVVGLTGGIGCGKTTVANLFAELGIAIVDSDIVAHALTAPGGAAMDLIRQTFGADFITADGAMDRARMREAVFHDDAAKARLEKIIHPLIRSECERQLHAARSPYVLFVVPLLFESGSWRDRVARTLVIDCPEQEQIARVMRRSGLTEEMVKAIMARQIARPARLALADDVIDNSEAHADLHQAAARLHEKYLAEAEKASK